MKKVQVVLIVGITLVCVISLMNGYKKLAHPQLPEALLDRKTTAIFISQNKERAKEFIPKLIQALNHKNAKIRGNAAFALGVCEKQAIIAVPELIKALKDSNLYVRGDAASALGSIGEKSAIAALKEVQQDRKTYVRRAAKEALKKIESKNK